MITYDVIFMIGGTMDRQFEPQTVGERIKFLREKNGESQQKLGEILGLTQNAISKLENGDTSLTLENQIRIAEHYNVSHDYICTGRNNDSILTLLEKYLSLKYIFSHEGEKVTIPYPVLDIDKPLFDYLVRTAQAKNNKSMPDDIKELWIEREKKLFYESKKNNDFSNKEQVIPLPPELIYPDDDKKEWKQSDLLRELGNSLLSSSNNKQNN